jgi:WD40 repeat protein
LEADDDRLNLWNLATGMKTTLKGTPSTICCVSISDDGTMLATATADAEIKLWDLSAQREKLALKSLPNSFFSRVASLAFRSDGRILAADVIGDWFGDQIVRSWNTVNGEDVSRIKIPPKPKRESTFPVLGVVTFAGVGQPVLFKDQDNAIEIWKPGDSQPKLTLAGHQSKPTAGVLSADGKRLASGCVDGIVKLWATSTGTQEASFKAHTSAVTGLAFNPNGRLLASCSYDGLVKIWNVPARKAPK